jgi:hypothetical protein
MQDLTPLYFKMHLRELERQATPRHHPLRAGRPDTSLATRVRAAMTTLLRSLYAVCLPKWMASQSKSYS